MKEMTPDFREGLIEGLNGVVFMIQAQLGDPKNTDDVKQALNTLRETVKLDLREIERGEGEKP